MKRAITFACVAAVAALWVAIFAAGLVFLGVEPVDATACGGYHQPCPTPSASRSASPSVSVAGSPSSKPSGGASQAGTVTPTAVPRGGQLAVTGNHGGLWVAGGMLVLFGAVAALAAWADRSRQP